MKNTGLVLIGFGALALWYFGNFIVSANTLQYIIKTVKFVSISTWKVIITVQNVGNVNIVLNSMDGVAIVNGTAIGNISSFNGAINILPNSQTDVTVTVNLSFIGLPGAVLSLIQSPLPNNTISFGLQGNVNANGIVYPFVLNDNVTLTA